ncbi:hypothetical protein ACFXTO_023991 [Malus domestica]
MASATSLSSGVALVHLPQFPKCCDKASVFARPHHSLSFNSRADSFQAFISRQLTPNGSFRTGLWRTNRNSRPFVVRCEASTGRGRITQQDFTEMAWQAIVSSPEVAKRTSIR